jgi:hypothetical protein
MELFVRMVEVRCVWALLQVAFDCRWMGLCKHPSSFWQRRLVPNASPIRLGQASHDPSPVVLVFAPSSIPLRTLLSTCFTPNRTQGIMGLQPDTFDGASILPHSG